MFYDLNLPHDGDSESLRARLATALSLGYSTVAVSFLAERAKLTPGDFPRWEPMDMGALLSAGGRGQRPRTRGGDAGPLTGEAAPRPRSFEQLSRITVTLETPAQCADLAASVPVARQHDILALRPTSERALAQCCTTLDVDVISLDLSQRLPVRLRPQLVKAAVQRGVVFEICYAPLIGDVSSRRQLLSNAISLVRACGGIALVSSGASSGSDMRPPADVANLGTLFGLSAGAGKEALSTVARALVQAAARRRQGKAGGMISTFSDVAAMAAAVGLCPQPSPSLATAQSAQHTDDEIGWGKGGVVSLGSGAERDPSRRRDGTEAAASAGAGAAEAVDTSAARRWPAAAAPAPTDDGATQAAGLPIQAGAAAALEQSGPPAGFGAGEAPRGSSTTAAAAAAARAEGEDDDAAALEDMMVLVDEADYFLQQEPTA